MGWTDLKFVTFLDVPSCNVVDKNVSEESAVSLFRTGDIGNNFIKNDGKYLPHCFV
jgi:hypothetical protein